MERILYGPLNMPLEHCLMPMARAKRAELGATVPPMVSPFFCNRLLHHFTELIRKQVRVRNMKIGLSKTDGNTVATNKDYVL